MDIAVFQPDELPIALGAVRAIERETSAEKDRFLEAIAHLHRTRIDPTSLPVPTPAETAAAIQDPHRRKRLLQLAMVMTTIDGTVDLEPTENVGALAAALDVDERGVGTLFKMARHHDTLARFDMARRIGKRLLGGAWDDEGWIGVRKILSRTFGSGVEDPELARRYNRIGLNPEGSFGRALWEHWIAHDFSMPGQKMGIPEIAVFHDLGHVLSGYGTDPVGEIQQAAFQAGFVRNDGFMFLFFGIAQFHLGMKITPVADSEKGLLDIDKVMTALARGASCNVDISDHWNFWPYLSMPLDAVRAALNVPPL